MTTTKLRKLYLRNYRQFRRCVIDCTGPDGRANDRVCFIGRNGTGKSTLLRDLRVHLLFAGYPDSTEVAIEVEHDGRTLLLAAYGDRWAWLDMTGIAIDPERLFDGGTAALVAAGATSAAGPAVVRPALDLVAYCPAETAENPAISVRDVPSTTLDDALSLFTVEFPSQHIVSNQHISEMWRLLVYLVKKLESDRQAFELRPENLNKTKRQLLGEFDRDNPSPLLALAALWNRILAPAGLELDVEGARVPVQLTDNLQAYIRLRGSKDRVAYGELSTGIRNFIFRVGHLFLLYFNRSIERGFVLIDEPENSLFPDFLFELMEVYDEVFRDAGGGTHTQLFVATHSPIIAAQFEPHERVVLELRPDGSVDAKKGTSPKGDDPNDLLRKDFGLDELLGPAGRESWRKYVALRKAIRSAPEAEKSVLVAEAVALAEQYGFPVPS